MLKRIDNVYILIIFIDKILKAYIMSIIKNSTNKFRVYVI